MSAPTTTVPWRIHRFGLLVTGRGESLFLDRLFRSICERMANSGRGGCEFRVLAKIEQLTPRTSPKYCLPNAGNKRIPTRDEEAALMALGFFQQGGDFVLLVDDREAARRAQGAAVYSRYCEAFDRVLPQVLRPRASVHFLVNMLEAYYFADAKAINAVTGTNWTDYDGDVELISHPKNELKKRLGSFDVIQQGEQIMRRLDVPHILSRQENCASLRTMFGWCWRALGVSAGEDYQLENGSYFDITLPQIQQLPPVPN